MSKEDMELLGMFSGEEKPLHPDTVHTTLVMPTGCKKKNAAANTTNTEKAAQKPTECNKCNEDVTWQPPKPAPNWLDKLKASAKWALTFGALCILFFYWQQTGQMAASAAVPSMCACTLLVGWGVGKNAMRGENRR